MNKIHFVYFSCANHFDYLYLSLKSLKSLTLFYEGNVYLYIDRDDFFDEFQTSKIENLGLNIILRKGEKVTGWGEKTVINEIKCFKEIHNEIDKSDYLTKVDSDILFFSSYVFEKVVQSNSFLIGQKESCWDPFIYTQGGCYFLRNEAISLLFDWDISKFKLFFQEFNKFVAKKGKDFKRYYPEDMIIYSIMKSKTDKIRFLNFYLPLKDKNNYEKFKDKHSVIHFQQCKEKMLDFNFKMDAKEDNIEEIYDEGFFDVLIDRELDSASDVVESLLKYFGPSSIIDVGCGSGIYLKLFYDNGIKDIIGYDGSKSALKRSLLPWKINLQDLRVPLNLDRKYDLCLCIEVAEHLDKDFSEFLVDQLINTSDIIFFTAATPGQGGTDHINEQPHEYWITLFEKKGYGFDSQLTNKLRLEFKNKSVVWWITKNLMIFRKND